MPDLFISHATKDDLHADELAALLADHAVTCWIDHQGGLTPGAPNWDSGIRAAIEDCGAGLLLMSPRSLASDICAAECLLLRELGKPLYVAYLEMCPPADIWLYIKMIQYADLRSDMKAGAAALARALRGDSAPDTPTPVRGRITGGDTMRVHLPYLNSVPLTGRDGDVERLRAILGGHVTQITAIGGTGKSRIAAELALSASNGAIWHRCDPTSGAFAVIDLIRKHYGLDEKTPDDTVIAALDGFPPLIVIDNAEDVPAGTDRRKAYADLLARMAAHGAPLLLASRVVWDELKPRREYPLNPISLDQAERVALDFAAAEALTLTDNDARTLADAARLHPRLIEFSVRQLHERELPAVLRQLRELRHDDVQEALDEMIVRTVRQMRETAKAGERAEALLRRLSVFKRAFERAAVSALTPDGMSEDEADDALALLLRWKFLRKELDRYRVEEVVSSALPADSEAKAAHFDYFAGRFADHDANNDEDRHPMIEWDWMDIRAALAWGFAERPEIAVAWLWALRYFMSLRLSRAEWRTLTQTGYDAALEAGDQLGQAHMLYVLGEMARITNEYVNAREYYDRALPIYEATRHRLGAANTLQALGDVARITNEYVNAREYYERTLPVYEAIGHQLGAATALKGLGDVAYMEDEYASAREYYGRALPIYQAIGARLGTANALRALGDVALQTNEYASAREYYGRALLVYEAIGAKLGAANALNGLGDVALQTNEYASAREYYGRALLVYEAIGARLGAADALQALGDVALQTNEYASAREYYRRALLVYEAIEAKLGAANSLQALGNLHQAIGEYKDAYTEYNRARAIYKAIKDEYSDASVFHWGYRTYIALGYSRDAVEGLYKALHVYERVGAQAFVKDVQRVFKEVRTQLGNEFEGLWIEVTAQSVPDWLSE